MTDDLDSLNTPLFDRFLSIQLANNGTSFDIGGLFWSLSRLFGIYTRIVIALGQGTKASNESGLGTAFLDADIESFLIRFRITLNDIAFLFRQLYPPHVTGLRSLATRSTEMSFRDLLKFLRKNPDFHPELLLALEKNVGWLLELIDQREEIVHYRAKVMIFTYAPNDLRFAIMKASGKQRVERTADGNRIVTTPVFQFINSQMKGLIAFINDDLIESVDRYVSEHNLPTLPVGVPGPTKISCTGIRLYKSLNNYSQ